MVAAFVKETARKMNSCVIATNESPKLLGDVAM